MTLKLHDLTPANGSRRERRRVGRGIAAGQGKTSGRGQKGQGARSSVSIPRGFEGGQMPLSQRLPKLRGFHNRFAKDYAVVNVGKLNRFEAGSVVDADALRGSGLVGPSRDGVKVLGAGRLRPALTLRVHRVSASARAAVEAAGGSVELVEQRPEPVEAATEALQATGEAPARRPRRAAAATPEPEAESAGTDDTGAADDGAAGDGDAGDE